uniref:Uncharacterized protein n=1 Tax=Lepeophtheirus salmonis TaxID=72036 RepID=A0A0K2VGQ8_LEPSM
MRVIFFFGMIRSLETDRGVKAPKMVLVGLDVNLLYTSKF